jgi:hypothetical protein
MMAVAPSSLVPTPLRTAPLRARGRAAASAVPARAVLQTKPKTKPKTKDDKKSKKLSQSESMQEMSRVVVQAFGVGIALPVGVVSLLEASKNIPGAEDVDTGLYGFIALALGFGVWWVGTGDARWGAERGRSRAAWRESPSSGIDVSFAFPSRFGFVPFSPSASSPAPRRPRTETRDARRDE